tara:strand:- start:1297 stop:2166 length:870 start_codon:yes stop_codon:yes gene_type:complete
MIIWLASYPKSGNTWLRYFIISLLFADKNKRKMNLNHLQAIMTFPGKSHFDDLVNDYLDFDEVAKNWLNAQEKINSDKQIRIFKTHNMNIRYKNHNFTNLNNTLAIIYIIRDPRNVITSLKNHFNLKNYQETKNFLFNESQLITLSEIEKEKFIGKKNFQLPQIIGSWKTHYESWKSIKKNFLLIKYENLIHKPQDEFKKISDFLGNLLSTKFSENQINNSINDSSFNNLKSMEDIHGFNESVYNPETGRKNKFFYLGPKNDWRNILDKDLSDEISSKFENEMKELDYL